MWPAREELLLATASLPPPGEQLLPAHIARWAAVSVSLIIAVQILVQSKKDFILDVLIRVVLLMCF